MDSMLCLDTSGSMAGNSLQELQRAVITFLSYSEKLDARVGISQFGEQTRVVVNMTNDHNKLRRCIQQLTASGKTPMAEGLLVALKELKQRGRVIPIGSITLVPRLILMTDGAPDSKENVLKVAALFGEAGIPISCVGVSGCDLDLMKKIAVLSGGMFHYASQIDELSLFFLQQILLSLYIAEFAERLDQLFSREILREYMKEKTGKYLSDEELDIFVAYLKALARINSTSTGASEQPDQPEIDQTSIACCCFILGFCCVLPWCFNLKFLCSSRGKAKAFAWLSCLMIIATAIIIPLAIVLSKK